MIRSASLAVILAGALSGSLAQAETKKPLPPPTAVSLQMRAPAPQWDAGLLLGGGAYEADGSLDHGAVRLGLELDSVSLRQKETDLGLGITVSASTFNFQDGHFGLGIWSGLEVVSPWVVELALRGGIATDSHGASPEINPELRLGLRSLNLTGHYGHAHLLTLGSDLSLAVDSADSRPRTTLYAALRLDAMWLIAPIRALF
jgi:hypothetical protein